MKLILFLSLSFMAFGQQTVNPTAITLNTDGQYAVQVFVSRGNWGSPSIAQPGTGVPPQLAETTIASPVLAGDSTITVTSGTGIGANDLLLIDAGLPTAEMLSVTSRTGQNVTVTRALVPVYCGGSTQPYTLCSTAAAHPAGATVQQLRTKVNGGGTLVQNFYNQIGKQLAIDALSSITASIGTLPSNATPQATINTNQATISANTTAAAQ